MPIITDPSPPQTAEGFILDPSGSSPLNLGNGGSLQLSALTIPPAQKRPEWASNADMDGAALVRNPYHDNRQCELKVRCMDGTMDQAIQAIKLLEDKLQEACIQGANNGPGLPFLWTPSHASTGLTGYMVFAQITDMPVTYDDGWFAQHPVVTVAFQCRPFLYGSEVTGPTASGTAPMLTVDVGSVPGDVPAEARLVITDGSSQARRWVEWGLEQRYYTPSSPWPLLIDSEDLVTSGFAGSQATRTGGYRRAGATHDTVSATLLAQTVAVCGTGDQTHIGTFRVKARIWAQDTPQYWRLTWKVGDGPYTSNDWAQPVASVTFNELDLGLITVPPAEAGAQKWSGRLEAYTISVTGSLTGEVDYLELFPAEEGYGRLEGAYSYQAGVLSAYDDFASLSGGSALNGHTALAGGSWATSGATTDFVRDTVGLVPLVERFQGSDAGYRFAILGTTTYTDSEVNLQVRAEGSSSAPTVNHAAVTRWTDANNHLRLRINAVLPAFAATQTLQLILEQVVGGTVTTLAQSPPGFTFTSDVWLRLRVVAFASGRALGWMMDANGNTLAQVDALSSVLATGGTLASGKAGFADENTTAGNTCKRYYAAPYVSVPASESLIINSGRSLQVRSDSNLRLSSDGTTYGDIASRGSRLFIPQAGGAARTSRIAVHALREDPVAQASRNDGDTTSLAVYYVPRYLAVPR